MPYKWVETAGVTTRNAAKYELRSEGEESGGPVAYIREGEAGTFVGGLYHRGLGADLERSQREWTRDDLGELQEVIQEAAEKVRDRPAPSLRDGYRWEEAGANPWIMTLRDKDGAEVVSIRPVRGPAGGAGETFFPEWIGRRLTSGNGYPTLADAQQAVETALGIALPEIGEEPTPALLDRLAGDEAFAEAPGLHWEEHTEGGGWPWVCTLRDASDKALATIRGVQGGGDGFRVIGLGLKDAYPTVEAAKEAAEAKVRAADARLLDEMELGRDRGCATTSKLHAYWADVLDEKEEADLEIHFAECDSCAARARGIQGTSASVERLLDGWTARSHAEAVAAQQSPPTLLGAYTPPSIGEYRGTRPYVVILTIGVLDRVLIDGGLSAEELDTIVKVFGRASRVKQVHEAGRRHDYEVVANPRPPEVSVEFIPRSRVLDVIAPDGPPFGGNPSGNYAVEGATVDQEELLREHRLAATERRSSAIGRAVVAMFDGQEGDA